MSDRKGSEMVIPANEFDLAAELARISAGRPKVDLPPGIQTRSDRPPSESLSGGPSPLVLPVTDRTGLIHGVFNPVELVRRNLAERLRQNHLHSAEFSWIGSCMPPTITYTSDPEVVVVLDVALGDLESTAEFAWEWAVDGQTGGGWRLPGLSFVPDRCRLLPGSEPFRPWTLRWRRIKLDANFGRDPKLVRDAALSPGTAGLWVAAQHPGRVSASDSRARHGWFLPGLECTVYSSVQWAYVPCVYFDRGDRRVYLDAHFSEHAYLGVPVFVK